MTRWALLAVLLAQGASAQTSSAYSNADDAAIAFVKLVRSSYPNASTKEYCAWILKGQDGKFRYGVINEGNMDGCYLPTRTNESYASVHTHPTRAGGDNLDAAGQVFSEGDFSNAEGRRGANEPRPSYLGAPAGHVLRYDPGGTECKGSTLIRRKFTIVSGLSAADAEKLPVKPGKFMPLFDQGGQPVPKPDYCKPAS